MKIPSFKFLVAASLLMIGMEASAQVDIGARGGISIPKLSAGGNEKNPLNSGYSSRLGPDFGVFAEYHVSKLFSVQAMVEYSSQGGQKSGLQAYPTPDEMKPYFAPNPAPTYLYADFKSEAKLNYLMVPILAKFGWDLGKQSPWRLYVDAGPFFGFLLSAKQVTSGSSAVFLDPEGKQPITAAGTPSFDATKDIKDQLNTFNFGISGNIGLAYHFNRSQIFVEGGGNYGFLNIQKGHDNGKNNTGAATVVLGYAYRLGK
ncbi:porin family protein [Chitinophaga vietnamensis]|uniref:porin family protein n=1 Tax=Chitinophaga vietnamensis TaxID=2593957 RepID=UPI001178386D|nr:porin family protein [Chitinophaga vietnamensis]